jgi:hypothetical protein
MQWRLGVPGVPIDTCLQDIIQESCWKDIPKDWSIEEQLIHHTVEKAKRMWGSS